MTKVSVVQAIEAEMALVALQYSDLKQALMNRDRMAAATSSLGLKQCAQHINKLVNEDWED